MKAARPCFLGVSGVMARRAQALAAVACVKRKPHMCRVLHMPEDEVADMVYDLILSRKLLRPSTAHAILLPLAFAPGNASEDSMASLVC